jgi:hypothetical protein
MVLSSILHWQWDGNSRDLSKTILAALTEEEFYAAARLFGDASIGKCCYPTRKA